MSSLSKSKKSHKAKSTREWKQRLRKFATGEKFGRGEAPSKGSRWDKAVQSIVACPAHRDGNMDSCVCKYHTPNQVFPSTAPCVQRSIIGAVGQGLVQSTLGVAPSRNFPGRSEHVLHVSSTSNPVTTVNSFSLNITATSAAVMVTSGSAITSSLQQHLLRSGTTTGKNMVMVPSISSSAATTCSSSTIATVTTTSNNSIVIASGNVNVSTPEAASQYNQPDRTGGATAHKSKTVAATSTPWWEDSHDAVITTIATATTCSSEAGVTNTSTEPLSSTSLVPVTTSTAPVSTVLSTLQSAVSAFPHKDTPTTVEKASSFETVGPSTAASIEPVSFEDPADRIPNAWKLSKQRDGSVTFKMSKADQQWIGETLFAQKNRLKVDAPSTLWWYPPPVKSSPMKRPRSDVYFTHRLFLWMPRRAWAVEFKCPTCLSRSLTSKGLYKKTLRRVLDHTDFYFLATEELTCNSCKKNFLSWDERLVSQLATAKMVQFPAIITKKYTCDVAVIVALRGRTLGNSSTALRDRILEQHTEEWMKKQLAYYGECQLYSQGLTRKWQQGILMFDQPVPMETIPCARWFMKVYAMDILRRLPEILATCTSSFGSILKIDSTKKICRKLQGRAAGSASWCTNVGNELGEVLTSVLTESEGLDGLRPMAVGLVQRYEKAKQKAPQLLYTDRDCCTVTGTSKCAQLFMEWGQLQVRLDIWHFMRRIARGVTSESHPLYGPFMSRLSDMIFEWDAVDHGRLCEAKRGCLLEAGVKDPSHTAILKAITREELARHCRRRTRGTEVTLQLIEELLLALGTATDSYGVPLFGEQMVTIWEEEKKHIQCIQDPPDVTLYKITGYINKGGVRLPVYRCARGTTSLESFHLHLARFIPGSSASDVHFQMYLLEGLSRWNQARRMAAAQQQSKNIRTFNLELACKVNQFSSTFHDIRLLPHHHAPTSYNEGEHFGVDYLFHQAGQLLSFQELYEAGGDDDDDDGGLDEGFVDQSADNPSIEEQDLLMTCEGAEEEDDDDHQQAAMGNVADMSSVADVSGITGWDKVGHLAQMLVELKGIALSASQADKLKVLYDALHDYDKRGVKAHLKAMPQLRGRFCHQRRAGASQELSRRSFLSGNTPPLGPSSSRIVEAVFILLCQNHPEDSRTSSAGGLKRQYLSKWKLILRDYNAIRSRLFNSWQVLEETNLALYPVNQTGLQRWHKNNARREEIAIRMQGIEVPRPPISAAVNLLPGTHLPQSPFAPPSPMHQFSDMEDTSGQARIMVTAATGTCVESQVVVSTIPSATPPVFCHSTTTASTSCINDANLQAVTGPIVGEEVEVTPLTLSRSSEYRHRKRQAQATTTGLEAPPRKERKEYCCKKCGQKMSLETGHSQFYGMKYCPNVPGQVPLEQWKAERREERLRSQQHQQVSLVQQLSVPHAVQQATLPSIVERLPVTTTVQQPLHTAVQQPPIQLAVQRLPVPPTQQIPRLPTVQVLPRLPTSSVTPRLPTVCVLSSFKEPTVQQPR